MIYLYKLRVVKALDIMFESFVSLLESATLSFIPYEKRVLTAGLSYILYLFLFNIAVVSAMHDYFSLIHADYAL